MLTQQELRQIFEYREDGRLIWKIRPNNRVRVGAAAGYAGRRTSDGRHIVQVRISTKLYSNHRLVWLWHKGFLPLQIDHIDRDEANDRIENLRAVTDQENKFNKQVVGATRLPRSGKWRAQIKLSGRNYWLGEFDKLEDAQAAYRAAKENLHIVRTPQC